MRFARICLTFLLFGFLTGCTASEPETYKEEAYVFGTLVTFTIVGVPEETARKAVRAVGTEFQHMHEDWHAWKPGELTRLNQAITRGEAREISDFLLPLIKQSKQFYQLSGGLFNPAIGGLVETWGFHSDELPKGSLPSFEKIHRLVARAPSMDDVQIRDHVVFSSNPAVQFDFGGFGKGAALDRAEQILKDHGIDNAAINAGGDLNTVGNPGNRPWKVGIRHPVHWGVIASVALEKGENLYTSGNYERFREHEGLKYAHIIDPRDGMPVKHIVSASVIDGSGALADAAATALTVAGPDHWYEVAQKMGVRFALLVDDKGRIYLNPAMKARIAFEPGEAKEIIVSEPLI